MSEKSCEHDAAAGSRGAAVRGKDAVRRSLKYRVRMSSLPPGREPGEAATRQTRSNAQTVARFPPALLKARSSLRRARRRTWNDGRPRRKPWPYSMPRSTQAFALLLALDPLGDDGRADAAADRGEARDDLALDRVGLEVAHERVGDLDVVGPAGAGSSRAPSSRSRRRRWRSCSFAPRTHVQDVAEGSRSRRRLSFSEISTTTSAWLLVDRGRGCGRSGRSGGAAASPTR